MTASRQRFVILHDVKNEDGIKSFFTEMYEVRDVVQHYTTIARACIMQGIVRIIIKSDRSSVLRRGVDL